MLITKTRVGRGVYYTMKLPTGKHVIETYLESRKNRKNKMRIILTKKTF